MSRVPTIDSPCPFRVANMPTEGRDHCGHCDRQVHNLDGMSSSQRETFLAGCSGKICVAYTVHRRATRRNVSLGMGLLAAMAGTAAMAGETPLDTRTPVLSTATAPAEISAKPDSEKLEMIDTIFVGGISNPAEARWSDESAVAPDDVDTVPEISEMDWLPSQAL
jgi:hypothetical protein